VHTANLFAFGSRDWHPHSARVLRRSSTLATRAKIRPIKKKKVEEYQCVRGLGIGAPRDNVADEEPEAAGSIIGNTRFTKRDTNLNASAKFSSAVYDSVAKMTAAATFLFYFTQV